VPPAAKPPVPAEKKSEKKKLFAIGALLTSTPFLIAIAIHALLLIGGGSIVIFKGGNPLAIFTSQDTGDGDVGAEAEAPPGPEEPMPGSRKAPTSSPFPPPARFPPLLPPPPPKSPLRAVPRAVR
jgi:hypothetical protein